MKNNELSEKLGDIFSEILGAPVEVDKKSSKGKKHFFIKHISKLESSLHVEEQIYQISGLELYNITDPLWKAIEDLLLEVYGSEVAEWIIWYIFERKDANYEIKPLIDSSGNEVIIDTPLKLWNYIKSKGIIKE